MILAIDQSYSDTGICYISKDGRIEATHVKTTADMPWEQRIDTILKALDGYFDLTSVDMPNPSPVKHVIIESYAYAGCSKIFQLGELGGCIKHHFHQKGVDAVTMHITHHKSFIAYNGMAQKNSTIKGLEARYGITGVKNDNICDALSIGLTFRAYLFWKSGIRFISAYDNNLMLKIDAYIHGSKKQTVEEKPKSRRSKKAQDKYSFTVGKKPKNIKSDTELNISDKARKTLRKQEKAKNRKKAA